MTSILVRDGVAYLSVENTELMEAIVDATSFKLDGIDFRARDHRADKRTKLVRNQKAPVGLLDRICRTMAVAGEVPQITYANSEAGPKPRIATQIVGVTPRGYQHEAQAAALLNDRGIFRMPTGAGKTLVAAMVIAARGYHAVVIVPTRDLLHQTRDYLLQHLIGAASSTWTEGGLRIGQLGDSVVDPQPVTVATARTMAKVLNVAYESYDYAEYDDSDDTDVDRAALRSWVESLGTVVCDECVTGDTLIATEKGNVPIRTITLGTDVVCYNGRHGELQPVTHFWDRGERDLVAVRTDTGVVRCTTEHPFWTQRGWVCAGNLTYRDAVLRVESYALNPSGELNTYTSVPNSLSAPVVVADKFYLDTVLPTNGLGKDGVIAPMRDTYQVMTEENPLPSWTWHRWSGRPFWAPCWGTRLFPTLTSAARARALPLIMDQANESGRNIKPPSCLVSDRVLRQPSTVDMARLILEQRQLPCQPWSQCTTWYDPMEDPSAYHGSGWMVSDPLGWLGGSVTTALLIPRQLSTQRVGPEWRFNLWQSGFARDMARSPYKSIALTPTWHSPVTHGLCLRRPYRSTSHRVCDISWSRVIEVTGAGRERVYDIGVKDNHNFVANGVLVHNCHQLGAQVLYDTVTKIPAVCKYGLSASPWRDDGADLMIEAATGPPIFHASAQRLVKEGHLMPPLFKVVDTSKWWKAAAWGSVCKRCGRQKSAWGKQCACGANEWKSQYNDAYKHEIVKNPIRNVNVVAQVVALQRPTLVLVKQVGHGRALADMIPNSVFLSCKDRTEVRLAADQSMRGGGQFTLVCTAIADQGLDIPSLGALVLAGGGKSSTRHLQRIGRVVRPFEGKERPVVVDFDDAHVHAWFHKHELRRREIEHAEWDDTGAEWVRE